MQYLRQSTATQAVLLGPYVDDTDGTTPETGLTIANTDIRLSANGGNMFAKTLGGGTHDENGWYATTFDATDTATVGRLQVSSKVAGALAVWSEFQILEENVYDAWYAASAGAGTDLAAILVDTAEIGTAGAGLTNIDLPNQTMDITGSITGNLSGSVGSVTGAVGSVTGAVGSVAGNVDGSTASVTGAVGSVAGNVDGSTASVTGAVGSVTGNVGGNVTGSVGSNLELGPAEVNAEVVDVINVDTFAEPTGVPPAAASLMEKLGVLYMALRNKVTVTASKKIFFGDDDVAEFEKDLSDDATTYTETEVNAP